MYLLLVLVNLNISPCFFVYFPPNKYFRPKHAIQSSDSSAATEFRIKSHFYSTLSNAAHCTSPKRRKTFCGFSMGRNQYWAGRVYDLCVYYMTGTPEGSTESGFMEKPGIEPATPGLQGIALIHYTKGAR